MRRIKRISVLLIVLIISFVFIGCNKAKKDCEAAGDAYMRALINCDYDAIEDLSIKDDRISEVTERYSDNRVADLFLSKAIYELVDIEVSNKDKTGTVKYNVILPDYEEALRLDPPTYDGLVSIIGDIGTTIIPVELSMKQDNDSWKVINYRAVEDFYSVIYGIDFGYVYLDGNIVDAYWDGAVDASIYESMCTEISYVINLEEAIDSTITFELYLGGEMIDSSSQEVTGENITFAYGIDDGYILSGEYTLVIKDSHGRELYTVNCSVDAIDYYGVLDYMQWYDCSEDEEGVYHSNSHSISFGFGTTVPLNTDITYNIYHDSHLVMQGEDYVSDSVRITLDCSDMGELYMPTGNYRIEVYDRQNILMYLESCEVIRDRILVVSEEWDYFLGWYHRAEDETATVTYVLTENADAVLTYEIYFEDTTLLYTGEVECDDQCVITFNLDDIKSDDIYWGHFYTICVYDPNENIVTTSEFWVEWNQVEEDE